MRRLWARYCRDGRLPPVVSALLRDAAALRARDRIDRLLATIRPVLAVRSSTDLVTRRDGRRIAVAGPVAMSSQALTHDIGQRVTAALTTGGVDVFLVDRDGEHLVFGILDESRRRAWDALQELAGETAWYVDWVRGGRRGTVALRRGSLAWPTASLDHVVDLPCLGVGDVVVGPEQATQLTFWELGTSGKHEMIGVRGQARFDIRSTPTVETIDGRDYPGRSAFPVGNGLERFVGDIDVVYTWVDGSDEQWRAAFDELVSARGT